MESNALEKLTNDIVVSRFFIHTPSRIQWVVKICEVVDLFLRKPFWFSIFGSIQLHSRALYILVTMDVRGYTSVVLGYSEFALLREKRRMYPFVYPSIVFCLYTALQCQSSMSLNSLVFHTSGGTS